MAEAKMIELHPTVRYLIICEDVKTDPARPRHIALNGLLSTIRSVDIPAFPLLYEEFCAFVQLAECRGPAPCRIEVLDDETQEVIFRTQERIAPLPKDPLEIAGINFRIRNRLFSRGGLYWVQFWYNGKMIAEHPLMVEAQR